MPGLPAKRQATQAGIGFSELSNGFATCADPVALQAICDRLGPGTIGVFFERWMSRLPLPLTEHDRAAGYWWELSMRQVEVSRTLVFDAPRHARGFFEALVADNLDIGRPDSCCAPLNLSLAATLIVRQESWGFWRQRDDGVRLMARDSSPETTGGVVQNTDSTNFRRGRFSPSECVRAAAGDRR